MAESKTKETEASVTDFIEAVGHETRKKDAYVILEMMKEITGMEPKMWGPSIIGFGSCHYKYESGREGDMPMLAFSPRKARQVLYILSNHEGQEAQLEKLGKYKTGKVCLYVNKLADVDMEVLREIAEAAFIHAKETYPETTT